MLFGLIFTEGTVPTITSISHFIMGGAKALVVLSCWKQILSILHFVVMTLLTIKPPSVMSFFIQRSYTFVVLIFTEGVGPTITSISHLIIGGTKALQKFAT